MKDGETYCSGFVRVKILIYIKARKKLNDMM